MCNHYSKNKENLMLKSRAIRQEDNAYFATLASAGNLYRNDIICRIVTITTRNVISIQISRVPALK